MSTKAILVLIVFGVFIIGSLYSQASFKKPTQPTVSPPIVIQQAQKVASPTPLPSSSLAPSPSPSASQAPSSTPETQTQSNFDKSKGNTAKAAEYGSSLLSLIQKASGGSGSFDVYVEEVNISVFVTIKYDSVKWSETPESLQKDLVATFVNATRVEFSSQTPHVYIKTAGRTAAEGSFSIWSGEPTVKLY